MKNFAIINAVIVTPFRIIDDGVIVVENGLIAELGRKSDTKIPRGIDSIDIGNWTCVPGFIDLHIHGAYGYDFAEADDEAYEEIFSYLGRHGTTGILATIDARPYKEFINNLRRVVKYSEREESNRILRGIHLEGPFLNREMCGAMNPDFLWEPSLDKWLAIRDAGRGFIKLMTIAPELKRALEIIREAAKDNIVLSIGHSTASFDEIETAIDNGIAHVTHIFNAMHPMHHRKPDVLVGSLLMHELKVQLIADGFHVHPAVMKLLYKLKGSSGIILISDAISAAGRQDGEYSFEGRKVNVRDGKAFLDDGTLAGSTLTLDRAVKTMVEKTKIPLTDAVRMAALNPARVLREDHKKGILAVGKNADIVVLNKKFEVQMTIMKGKIIYKK